MKTLYIIRHGETEWNKIGRYQGITDVPLNDNGIAQAKACANALKDVHFDRILSSDLSRALVTAETIRGNRNVDITVDSRLREVIGKNYCSQKSKNDGQALLIKCIDNLILSSCQMEKAFKKYKIVHGMVFQNL